MRGASFFRGLGLVFLALAALGAVLPVLPTTPFVLLAAWAFARGAPERLRRLEAHPRYGPLLRAWRERGAIPRRAKRLATLVILASALFLVGFSELPAGLLALALALMAYGLYFVHRRPDA